MEGIASRRLRRAINVVKNELRPKGPRVQQVYRLRHAIPP